MRYPVGKFLVLAQLACLLLSFPLQAQRRQLASLERRFPSNWCPMVTAGSGSLFTRSFGMQINANARLATFSFSIRNNGSFGDLEAGIDNIVLLRPGLVPDLQDYSLRASQLGIECDPDGYSLDLARLASEFPEAIVFREHFSDAQCSDSPARSCWSLPTGVFFNVSSSAPDDPGSGSSNSSTGSLEFAIPEGSSLTTSVTLSNLVFGEQYLLTGWWFAQAENPEVQLEAFVETTPQAPPNDLCVEAFAISGNSFLQQLNTDDATGGSSVGEPEPSCGFNQRTVWYRFTAPSDGLLRIDTAGSDFDTVVAVYGDDCFVPREEACSDNPADSQQARLVLPVLSGQTLLFQVGGAIANSGDLTFALDFQAASSRYFPQVAFGESISTVLELLSLSRTETTFGLLSLYGTDGMPLQVSGRGSPVAPMEIEIPPDGTTFVRLQGGGPAVQGWAVLDTSLPVDGVATFERRSGARLESLAGVLGTSPLRAARIPVQAAPETGLAVANPNDFQISVELTPLNPDGSPAGPSFFLVLGPRQHRAGFISDLSGSNLPFQGSLLLAGTDDFIVTGLVVREGLFSALPVVPIETEP